MSEPELEALYIRLEKPVYNVLYRRVWNREEARDLVQETFVRLWKMRHKIVMDTVEPLVYSIALNLARSKLRRRKLLGWVPFDAVSGAVPDAQNMEEKLSLTEERADLREAVMALPGDLRDVILLCEFTGMKYEQIARTLSIPEGTVGSRRNRALKQLKVHFERS